MAAVVEVVLKHGSCEGPNIKTDGSRTYRDTYMVRTDVPINDGNLVLAQAREFPDGIPDRGTPFRSDPGAICGEYSPKQDSDAQVVWWIGVGYDSKTEPGDNPDVPPWDKPTRWSWGGNRIEEAQFWDLDGKVFQNTAKDRFNPPVLVPRTNPVLVIEQNRLDYDAIVATDYADAVNGGIFANFPAKTMKMGFPTASEERAEGKSYWKVTYEIEIIVNDPINLDPNDPKHRAWVPTKVLNIGSRYIDDNGNLVLAHDDNKVAGGQEVFLDFDGGKVDNPTPAIVMQYIQRFRVYRLRNFSVFGL